MKNDFIGWVMVIIAIVSSVVVSSIVTCCTIERDLEPYMKLSKELEYIKDSLSIQENIYQFTIEKDTIINQTIKINYK